MHVARLLGVPILLILAAWAFWPLGAPEEIAFDGMAVDEDGSGTATTDQDHGPLDPALFAVALWNPLRPPEEPEEPAAPSAPVEPAHLELELVGITRRSGQLEANVYDARLDEIVIVRAGQRVRDYEVTEITADSVALKRGQATFTLRLEGQSR